MTRDPHTGISFLLALAIPAAMLTAGCGGEPPSDRPAVARDTLPDGTVVVRYPALPLGEPIEIVADLRMGSVDGDPYLSFADVRGIDVGSDGTIYVLDYQLSELRAFDPDGNYRRTVVTEGEGPGEISEANGFILAGDSILWIQDHGKWSMIGVTTEGEEVGRYQMPVRSYGYMWRGTIDDAGRLWRPVAHAEEERRQLPPQDGLNEGMFREYLKWFDPGTDEADSVFLGRRLAQGYVVSYNEGYSSYGIPFLAEYVAAVDRAGEEHWQASNAAYRIAHVDIRGDTLLVIEADVAPIPATAADRSDYVERMAGDDPDRREAAEEVSTLIPDRKPVIDGLVVDDAGRLWVDRVVPLGEHPLYDVFEPDGDYLGDH